LTSENTSNQFELLSHRIPNTKLPLAKEMQLGIHYLLILVALIAYQDLHCKFKDLLEVFLFD